MKNIRKNIFSGAIIALSFFFTLCLVFIVYAGFTSMTKVGTGSGLTSTAWNQMVDNFDFLNQKSQNFVKILDGNALSTTSTVATDMQTAWKATITTNGGPVLVTLTIPGITLTSGSCQVYVKVSDGNSYLLGQTRIAGILTISGITMLNLAPGTYTFTPQWVTSSTCSTDNIQKTLVVKEL